MARLISKNVDVADRRVEDTTDGHEFVVAHNKTEADICEIFGIKDKQNINSPIFGSVRSDGGVQLVRFKMKQPGTAPWNTIGIEFRVGNIRKRLSFAGGEIRIWTRDQATGAWTSGVDFESDKEPALVSKTDCKYLAGYSGDEELVGVTSAADLDGKYWFTYYPKTAISSGYTKWQQMSDVYVPLSELDLVTAGYYKPGRIMVVNDSVDDPKFTLITPPSTDTQQYGLFKSASFSIIGQNAGIPIGFASENWAPGIEVTSGKYDDNIGVTGDVYHPRSEFSLDRGVYSVRTRLRIDAKSDRNGYFNIFIERTGDGEAFPERVTISQPGYLEKAAGLGEFIFSSRSDGDGFRFLCFCKNSTSVPSCSLFVEIERIN